MAILGNPSKSPDSTAACALRGCLCISGPAVGHRLGIDPQRFFAGIGEQAIKDQLKVNTDEVIARGGFGSPTIFVDKTDMYFGNDRLPLIREAVLRRKVSAA